LPEQLPRVVGLTWLLACPALVGAASMFLFRYGPWWFVAGVGIIVSQLLVIYAWPDTKAGTLLNIVLLVPVVVAWADARFQKDIEHREYLETLWHFSGQRPDATERYGVGLTRLAWLPMLHPFGAGTL
jgi:hypothetical protein